mgnify:CR=1 FL=1
MNVASQKTLQQKEWATIDSAEWENIDWNTVEARVNKLQSQITKAVIRGHKTLVKKLQYLLSKSYYAKLLSVRKVTTSSGKKTPGIDGELWTTSKIKAMFHLTVGFSKKSKNVDIFSNIILMRGD